MAVIRYAKGECIFLLLLFFPSSLLLEPVHTRWFPPCGLVHAVNYSMFVYGIVHT